MEKIGHYTIVSELGRGGMGVVYKAHEESLNRFVALKVLGEHLADDTSYVQRFLREAQSAAKLNHPNIVQVYATGREGDQHFIALEYIAGSSLQKLLRDKGKMESRQAARIILQTAAGLEAAHEAGIIHRDIKPANILLTDRGLVKIADFGLALLAGGASRLTATGMFMGTPGYLSPEQCLDKDVDHRTDIYSLGVTFFEMLTGGIPFKADSPLALLRQIIEVEPPDVRELNPEVDDVTRSILNKMMVKDKTQRYPSCHELIVDLQRYLEEGGSSHEDVSGVVAGTSAALRPGAPAAGTAQPTVRASVPPSSPPPAAGAPTAVMAEPAPSRPAGPTPAPVYSTAPTVIGPSSAAAPPPPPPTAPPSLPPMAAVAPPMATPRPPTVEIVHAPPPSRRAPVGLIVGAVVVVGFLGLAAAAGVAWKVGLFKGGRAAMAAPTVTAGGREASASGEPAVTQPSAAQGSVPEIGVPSSGGSGQLQVEAGAGAPSAGASQSGGEAAGVASTEAQAPKQTVSKSSAPAGRSVAATGAQGQSAQRPQPKAAAPPPEGVVVVARGERLLAGEAESFVERALTDAGIHVVPAPGLPDGSAEGGPRALAEALRPYAHYLVVVDAEFLGERQLQYMGRSDTAYQARLQVKAFDLRTSAPVGSGSNERVEYTQLTVGRVVENQLRPQMRALRTSLVER